LKSISYIVVAFFGTLVLIGYLFFQTPDTAATQAPYILAAFAGLAALLFKQGEAEAKIAIVDQKTDATNHMVDGQLTAALKETRDLKRDVASLHASIAELKQDKAIKQVETAQIIAVAAASVPPSVEPTGTPAHGTPVVEPS
jgi:hypothetical protein